MACALLWALPIAAQPGAGRSAPAPSKTEGRRAEAGVHFKTGLSLFNEGNGAGALAEFQTAYSLVPNPLVLFNIGLTYASLDLSVEAVESLKAVLRNPGYLGPRVLNRAQEVLFEQEKRIGTVALTANVPAQLTVDGRAAGALPRSAALQLSPGTHTIMARAGGYQPLQLDITITGGEKRALRLALPRLEPAQAPPPTADRPTQAIPPIDQPKPAMAGAGHALPVGTTHTVDSQRSFGHDPFDQGAGAKVTGWVVLAAGVAVLAGGGVLTAIASGQVEDKQAQLAEVDERFRPGRPCHPATLGVDTTRCQSDHRIAARHVDEAETLQLTGHIGIGVGAAAVIGGSLIVLLADRANHSAAADHRPMLAGMVGPDGGGLSYRLNF